MNKIETIGIVALVIFGCILTAGCTSSTSSFSVSEDKIIGTWTDTNSEYGNNIQHTYVFRPGGMGVDYQISNNEYMLTKLFTWQRFVSDEGVNFDISYIDGDTCSFTYNSRNDTLTSSHGGNLYRIEDAILDPIVGTWVSSDKYLGETTTMYMIFKWDNTGLDVERLINGNTQTFPFIWKNEGDVYKIEYKDGDMGTIVLDVENDIITYSLDAGINPTNYIYKNLDSTGLNQIIGTWAGTNKLNGIATSYIMIFDADKTGLEYEIKPNGNMIKYDFYWDEDEENNYIIKYIDGNKSKFTYNSEKDTLINEDGIVLKRKK